MNITHKTAKDQLIAYKSHKTDKKIPTIVFIHGLKSTMESSKALYLQEFAEKNNLNYIRFDNFGSGGSSGDFSDQTISSWLEATEEVIKNLCPHGAILVGSSKGGWIALLAAIRNHIQVKGLVTIAAAPDFTEDIWKSFSSEQKEASKKGEIVDFAASPDHSYPLKYKLFEDAKHYLLLNQNMIPISCKIRLLHGKQDKEAPYKKSLDILDKVLSNDARCIIVKSANHGFSRPEDLELISKEIMDLL
jgi:uncharacterized protein